MSRNYDWSPLGFYSDPVPGEPSTLTTQVAKYRAIATSIQDSATNLTAIINNYASQSEFVEAFAEQAEEVIGDIRKAKKKYSGFANAVDSYIEPLREGRRASYQLLLQAQSGDSDLATAEKWQRYWQQEWYDADPADQPDIQKKIDRYEDDAADARLALQGLYSQITDIVAAVHTAAKAAADAIQETGDNSGINDSGWTQFWTNNQWISKLVDVLAVIAAVALIVALCIPGLNVLVGAIILIGTIIAAVSALIAVMEATAGTKTWGEAIFAVALAILPVAGTFLKPAAAAVRAGMAAGKPALMASSAAQGIRGVTGPSAALAIEHLVAMAKPSLLSKILLGSADDLARMQAIRNLTIGPSGLIDDALRGSTWKILFGGSPAVDLVLGVRSILSW